MAFKQYLSVGLGALALGVVGLSVPALAAHGKAGEWQITTKMDMAGMPVMSAEQMEKMRAMGMRMPMGNTFTTGHCMTPAEVAGDKPPSMGRNHECTMANMKTDGRGMSADMVCNTADMQGNGHFSVTYDSPEHYAGR